MYFFFVVVLHPWQCEVGLVRFLAASLSGYIMDLVRIH
jgi:hypothetical protein